MKTLEEYTNEYMFLPDATRGAVRFLTTEQLESTGTKGLVTNTLHLLINYGADHIAEIGGIKNIMDWDGMVLTDSGGFQVFSLIHSGQWKGKVHENGAIFKSPKDGTSYELTPESSIDIQMKIGSDILVCLDDCRKTDLTREEAEVSVKRTIDWAKRCKNHFENVYGGTQKTGKYLTCVVQGANFIDLRKYCSKELAKLDFDGYNFGGFVVDGKGDLVLDEMKAVVDNTPKDKVKYAMGVGKPDDIRKAASVGYKWFDTVLVTRNARHGTLYSTDIDGEVMRIKNAKYANDLRPIDSKCDCEVCKRYSRAYIHHLLRIGEATGMTLSSIHNLRYYQRLIENLQNQS
jgi:queuine tRNA-ribosyltransferase